MAIPTHITVTAPEGRRTPIPERDGVAPGGSQMVVTDQVVARIRYSMETIRSINRRDLVPCDMHGSIVDSVELAAAPIDHIDGIRQIERKKEKTAAPSKKEPAQ